MDKHKIYLTAILEQISSTIKYDKYSENYEIENCTGVNTNNSLIVREKAYVSLKKIFVRFPMTLPIGILLSKKES